MRCSMTPKAGDRRQARLRLAAWQYRSFYSFAVDNGQFDHVPGHIRDWFKGVVSPNGVPCCDISDGHRTEYDFRDGSYWVPIEGKWMRVPAHTIIRDRGNPVGEAVVWYVRHGGSIIISCFVPADAV